MNRLMIVLNDPISPILEKGEITDRYYNPENVFDEVHIVLLNRDEPDFLVCQRLVGTAQLYIHTLPPPRRFLFRTLGYCDKLMGAFLGQASDLASSIQPNVIRAYGAHVNLMAANRMAEATGCKVICSLHHHPEIIPNDLPLIDKIRWNVLLRLAKKELAKPDLVIAVYLAQIDFLRRVRKKNITLCYNALNGIALRRKSDYRIGKTARVLSVGRLIVGKNPEHLIRAVAEIDEMELLVVGDGELSSYLHKIVDDLRVRDRVKFIKSINNSELCRMMPDFDFFATQNDYPGVPKAVLEPLLSGLPVVLNRVEETITPELADGICLQVENNKDGYKEALEFLAENDRERERLGRKAYELARKKWAPHEVEMQHAEIYKSFLRGIE